VSLIGPRLSGNRRPARTVRGRVRELPVTRVLEIRQDDVKRVELVKTAMPTDRRARTAIACASPVVAPLERAVGQVARLDRLCQSGSAWRDVVKDPMHAPGLLWRGGSGASGSSTISGRLFVPADNLLQTSGTEMSLPWQVHRFGIGPLWLNADEVGVSAMRVSSLSACRPARVARMPTMLPLQRRKSQMRRPTTKLNTIMVVKGANSLKPGLSTTMSPGRRPNGNLESQGHRTPTAAISRLMTMRARCMGSC